MKDYSPLDGYVVRNIVLDKLIKDIDRHMEENSKEEAEASYKELVDLFNKLKFRDQIHTTAKFYYIDVIDIYAEKLRRHKYKKPTPPLTLSDKIDNLV